MRSGRIVDPAGNFVLGSRGIMDPLLGPTNMSDKIYEIYTETLHYVVFWLEMCPRIKKGTNSPPPRCALTGLLGDVPRICPSSFKHPISPDGVSVEIRTALR